MNFKNFLEKNFISDFAQKKAKKDFKKYSKTQIKFCKISFFIIGILFIILSIPLLPAGLINIVIGLFCISLSNAYKKLLLTKNEKNTIQKAINIPQSKIAETVSEDFRIQAENEHNKINTNLTADNKIHKSYQGFMSIIGDNIKKYEYQENLYTPEDIIELADTNVGKEIEFKQENDNPYDSNAVAVYLADTKIGYVYRGKVQDMINDWIKRNDYFLGFIDIVDKNKKQIKYKIAFYKKIDKSETKKMTLVKTNKKICDGLSREVNFILLQKGDKINIAYDIMSESWVVYDGSLEVGELPSSAKQYLFENEDYAGTVTEIYYDSNGNRKAKVSVYIS